VTKAAKPTEAKTLSLHGGRIEIAPGAVATLGARLKELAPDRRVAIIADQSVGQLYGAKAVAGVLASGMTLGATTGGTPAPGLYTFPAGEQNKTRATWGTITDQLIAAGHRRDSVIVALGGGVTGDLAGFVAATFLRGVPVVQVPTTLLAMIDAAIGGKTGVDTTHGKNLVGAFHQPILVLIDPLLLRTLPPQHLRTGLAEAIKHGVIADAAVEDGRVAGLEQRLSLGGERRAVLDVLVAVDESRHRAHALRVDDAQPLRARRGALGPRQSCRRG
jgi:3-dehydroquinate synthase